MQRRWPVFLQSSEMLWRAVTLVGSQVILRVLLRYLAHCLIAFDLSDDGSRSDGNTQSVTVNDLGLRNAIFDTRKIDNHRVHEQMVGYWSELRYRIQHRQARSVIDVDGIYSLDIDERYCDGN